MPHTKVVKENLNNTSYRLLHYNDPDYDDHKNAEEGIFLLKQLKGVIADGQRFLNVRFNLLVIFRAFILDHFIAFISK